MTLETNCDAIRLYFKHITQEVFPERFMHEHENDVFKICIGEAESKVTAKASYLKHSVSIIENVLIHPSLSTARSCAVGKCVLEIAKLLGYPPPPYGVLTGVRPLKIANEISHRFTQENLCDKLSGIYLVNTEKGELLNSCIKYDAYVRNNSFNNDVSLYVSIPFCPSRCNYCSFVSSSIESKKVLIPEYINLLANEINEVSKVIKEFGLNVKSIYIGGGTPGILDCHQLNFLLNKVSSEFLSDKTIEFCFEIGRPDTVTTEKLNILKFYGVNRICINTQTTNDEILEIIGRKHTASQYFNAIELAKKFAFDSINTDIIAGLTNETLESFKKTVDDVINIGVDNLTVHTLCIKKSADIKKTFATLTNSDYISEFLNYSKKACITSGFEPYYLYRQKYALGNHESVGYCKFGKFSYYNIAMMNEIQTVIGMGAGATSRIVSHNSGEKHSHFENYKYPQDYIRDLSKTISHTAAIRNAFKQIY